MKADKERDIAVIVAVSVTFGAIIIIACAYFLWAWNAIGSGMSSMFLS